MLSKFERVGIKSIAACLPSRQMSLLEYAPELITEKEVKRFAKSTGFSRLAITEEDITTSDLCYAAAEHLIKSTQINKDCIDGLIFVSQTPDWYLPATSHYLQNKLALSSDCICFDINEGCSGYGQGLYLASMLIASQQCRNVLVLAGDTISKITDPSDRATRLIFGDAGTASIVSTSDKSMYFNINSYGERYDAIITNGSRHRVNHIANDNGKLSLDGMGIMDFTLNDVPQNMNKLMEFASVRDEDIDLYACHQANKLILNSLADKMGIDRNRLPFSAGEVGNTSSASIPLLLCQNNRDVLRKVFLCGFGVGLACASCITDLSNTGILDVITYESGKI